MSAELTDKQEFILYRIAIRQDEQGRQSCMMRKAAVLASETYTGLIDSGYLGYVQSGEDKLAIVNLIPTDKGMRYCYDNLDRLSTLEKGMKVTV